jgi:hypothetical protein
MDIIEESTASGGRYLARLDGEEAEMTYSRTSDKLIIIDHTGVPDGLRGKGVGQALALTRLRPRVPGAGRSSRSVPFSRPRRNAIRSGAMP